MYRLVAALAVLLVATGLSAVVSAPAHADTITCRDRVIGPRTIDGDVVVPRGADCVLRRTTVKGNVFVRAGAKLVTRNVRIDGNIQGSRTRRVEVLPFDGRRTVVDGNIQLDNSRAGGGLIRKARVNGDIQLFDNNGRFRVVYNIVDGNLQCKGNSPRPVGHSNRVHGNKEDQCRGM